MKKFFLISIIVLIALTSCGPSQAKTAQSVPTSTNAPIDTVAPTNTSAPSATPTITNTPLPTNTPEPTNTPRPTNTPVPTATLTPTPAPIVLTGTGDSVVDLDKWDGAALLHITDGGGSNFAIWNYGPDGEKIDLLVNTIGKYDGIRPLDFLSDEDTARFSVESSGQWKIEV